jgi:SAM-dependent methyltransferase
MSSSSASSNSPATEPAEPTEPAELAELAELLQRWRADLAAWAIPERITSAVADSPWVLPAQVFARRADRLTARPTGSSFEQAWAALDPPGSVLDIGAGAGAACLPLHQRLTGLTAVDASQPMLDLLAERAAEQRIPARCVLGSWPQVAPQVPAADVVTCHHVVFNVPDLQPFLAELTSHARRLVVLETATEHPLTSLNELWLRFWGLVRPTGPASDDLLAILTAMGLRHGWQRWRRPSGSDYRDFAELTEVTRRRLCLPPDRANEVAAALVEAGIDPARPVDLGSSGREVVTIWWAGGAPG